MVIAEAYADADVADVADGEYVAAEDVEEGVGLEYLAASAEDAVDASEAASAEEQEELDGAFDDAAGLGASAVASAVTYVAAAAAVVVAVAYVAEVVAFADSGREVAPCDLVDAVDVVVDAVGVASDAVDDVDPASGVVAEVAGIELEEVQTCGIQPEEEHGLEQGGDVQHVDLLERVGAVAEEAASLGALEAAAYAVDEQAADAYVEA